ncbi:MAG: rhodanese-like domain-containing protein [Acidimicrobiia bacterium]
MTECEDPSAIGGSVLEEVGRDELVRRLEPSDVIAGDVRPSAEYPAGHIAGAVSITNDRRARQLRILPTDVACAGVPRMAQRSPSGVGISASRAGTSSSNAGSEAD